MNGGSGPEARQVYAMQLLKSCSDDPRLALQEIKLAARTIRDTQSYRPKNEEIIVRVEDMSKTYKMGKTSVKALKNVSLSIHKGEFVAITGTSGSGKSTLLQLIGGLDKPSTGTIVVHNQDLSKLRDAKLSRFRNRTIGFVFQFFYLQPFLRLQTNIEVPAMFARTKRLVRTKKSNETAEIVGLADRLRHYPRELSGGQMQRAAIARALQNDPDILLADEPTGNLDHTNATAIFDLFRQIRDKRGTTVVVVTHDMALASQADRVITMVDGGVVA
ncbi:MAG: ABC transporter ATP-binding protein [Candidatus Saccharimonadales bacterium]